MGTMYEMGCSSGDELEQRYYEWLTTKLLPNIWWRYTILIRNLYETSFRVTLLMDENRVGDGLGLRSRFAYENHLREYEHDILKRQRPCSVLEVMIGLAQRFEEEYMTQYTDDNPIEPWFCAMINSLGLQNYDDRHFDCHGYDRIINNFLNRDYSPDGRGSLFYIPDAETDMRQVEIWRQIMMWNKHNGG